MRGLVLLLGAFLASGCTEYATLPDDGTFTPSLSADPDDGTTVLDPSRMNLTHQEFEYAFYGTVTVTSCVSLCDSRKGPVVSQDRSMQGPVRYANLTLSWTPTTTVNDGLSFQLYRMVDNVENRVASVSGSSPLTVQNVAPLDPTPSKVLRVRITWAGERDAVLDQDFSIAGTLTTVQAEKP